MISTHDKAKALEQQGAHIARTPGELAAGCQVVMACVTDDGAQEEVMFGPDGALAGVHGSSSVIDLSTVSPDASRRLYQAAKEKNVPVIDAQSRGLVLNQASALSVSMPATAVAQQMYAAAMAKGMDEDFSTMIKFMVELAGVSTHLE